MACLVNSLLGISWCSEKNMDCAQLCQYLEVDNYLMFLRPKFSYFVQWVAQYNLNIYFSSKFYCSVVSLAAPILHETIYTAGVVNVFITYFYESIYNLTITFVLWSKSYNSTYLYVRMRVRLHQDWTFQGKRLTKEQFWWYLVPPTTNKTPISDYVIFIFMNNNKKIFHVITK